MLPLRIGRPEGRPLRLLCLGAHSDDIEIGCGGTVMTLIGAGAVECTWAVFAAGDPVRREEALRSADRFLQGAAAQRVVSHAFRDAWFPAAWGEIKAAVEALKDFEPDLILTHRRDDRHQDHRLLAELTWNAFRNHLVLEYEIPKYEGDLGQPNVYVPLAPEVADRKLAILLEEFASQRGRGWFDEATFRGLMRLRGLECAAPSGWAEAHHAPKTCLEGDMRPNGPA
jgi:LmbE family N-acetylglucosaminyl deacetylase